MGRQSVSQTVKEGQFAMICYNKVYPFEKAVFEQKFIARTVPFYERIGSLRPLGRKLEGRVFVGEIREEQFKVATIPDIMDAVRHPWAGIRKVPVWRNPSCIYGHIYEYDGHTVVDYTIEIMKSSRYLSIDRIVWGCLFMIMCIISVYMEGFQPGILLGIVMIILFTINSISALQPHWSEHEALIKFMEDLEK